MHTPPPATSGNPPPPAYRTTWIDRNGPDAGHRLKAWGWGLRVFGLTITASFLLLAQGAAHAGVGIIVQILAIAAIPGGGVGFLGLRFASGSGAVMKAFTLPSGSSTPYEEQYSWREAMIARGDVSGALESFEAIIAGREARNIAGITTRGHALHARKALIAEP